MENIEDIIEELDLEDVGDVQNEITPGMLMEMLEEAWLNEKFAPEILPHKSEVVDCLLGQISYMEENLENLESTNFLKSLHQMEVDRLKFLITSYLRARLEKIEAYPVAILKQEQQRANNSEDLYLTDGEVEFAKSYVADLEKHFENVMKFWPDVAPPTDWKREPLEPNMNSFVFLKSKSEIEGVVINEGAEEEGDIIDFKTGTQIIISYGSVTNLVKSGEVRLI